MSRQLAEAGIYPAVDPRRSSSRLLDPAFIGADHFEVAQHVLAALSQVDATNALGARARRIRNFLSQPFFVAEPYTTRPGAFVSRTDTIAAFKALLSGAYDQLPEEAFLMHGNLDIR
jgi:F-type H+/Na+-transporting ATPase subunit beta